MDKLNLKQKLVAIRKEIGILQKTENGNQGAKYVDPAVILLKIRESMDFYNVLLTLQVTDYKNSQIPAPTSKNPNNQGYLSENTLCYTWHDADSDEVLSCNWLAVGSHMQDPSMAFGGALTYSERYFILKFFQVPTTKDDPEFLRQKAGVFNFINIGQVKQLTEMLTAIDKTEANYCKYKGVKSLQDITVNNFNACVSELMPGVK